MEVKSVEGSGEERSQAAVGSSVDGVEREDVICDGKYVVVERGDQQRIILFKSHQTISFGKGSTQQDILLAGAFGSSFLTAFKASPAPPDVVAKHRLEKKNSKRHPWKNYGSGHGNAFILEKSEEPVAKVINDFYQLPDSVASGEDNRNIVDDNSSQMMKKQDIVSLREQGVSSKEILDTILTSSKSFSQKTEFAQEKYLKKKERIYGDVLVFHKPSISILADYYYKRESMKMLGLRPDTVSQILSYANIHANGKFLIFDNCNGLIVAAVLRRLGGYGQALHCHIGSCPSRQALVCMNFTARDLKPMLNLDLLYLLKTPNPVNEESEEPASEEPKMKKSKLDDDIDDKKNGKDGDSLVELDSSKILKHINSKEDNEKSLSFFNKTEFDGLIICAKEHPLSLFQQLVTRLALSTPFVIYCQYSEPLMDCYMWIKEKGFGCNVHLIDNWVRNIQVETERTHPEIQMSPSGGYLLYGTFVGSSVD